MAPTGHTGGGRVVGQCSQGLPCPQDPELPDRRARPFISYLPVPGRLEVSRKHGDCVPKWVCGNETRARSLGERGQVGLGKEEEEEEEAGAVRCPPRPGPPPCLPSVSRGPPASKPPHRPKLVSGKPRLT